MEIDLPKVPYIPFEERDAWSQRYFRTIRQDEYDVSETDMLRARRAYYAMISFIDDQVGLLMDTLRETGFAKYTIVIFASDHGEMLGERGMWFKFNPFEDSIRVPLIVNMPGQAQPDLESRAVSLIDLLPTFLDMATDGAAPPLAEPIDGSTLLPMLQGRDTTRGDAAVVEYMAEGVGAPAIILRRDGMKYVQCGDAPPMMFDLIRDPLELKNLATDPAYASTAKTFQDKIAENWDCNAITRDVLLSQARRRVVQKANGIGQKSAWDYTVPQDGTKQYVRPDFKIPGTTDIKRKARYPFVAAATPQHPRKT